MLPGIRICILTAFLLWLLPLSSQASCQDTIPRNALSFRAGYTFPFSTFAQKTFPGMSGFASGGAAMDFRLQRYFGKYIGGFAEMGVTTHFFSERAYISEYIRVLGTDGDYEVSTGNYHFLSGRFGFMAAFPEFADTRIVLDAGLGYVLCLHPYLSVYNTKWGQINTVNRDLDLQIMSAAGLSVEHTLNTHTGILFSWSIYAFKPDFRDREGVREMTFYMPVRYMNFTMGINRYF